MLKKIIDEIIKALGLAILIIIAMFVIRAANLDLGSDTEDEVIYIDGESTLGQSDKFGNTTTDPVKKNRRYKS